MISCRESEKHGRSTANHPKFLTVDEVAAMLRIKARTVYEMVSQKRIPFRKAGRRTVFLLDEIMEWTGQRQ
jgi:excisionase family DNA binding protein